VSSQQALSWFAPIVGAFLVALGGFWLFAGTSLSLENTRSVEDHGVFYRLVSKYQHGNEIIDFDIVVGCGVRVTRYGDGDKSYDAFRDPVVYAKAISGGAAVMQIVPSACFGETSDNGRVPDDFLPGAIWFDRADDLTLGIAYVTEDAFESPKSKLRFLGASIHPASPEDWETFQPTAAANLIDPRPLFTMQPIPSVEETNRNLDDRRSLAKLWTGMSCYLVTRLHVSSEAARAIVREYWPSSRPRYWAPTEEQLNEIDKRARLFNEMSVDGHPAGRYLLMGEHTGIGFPTRAQGGAIGSAHRAWDLLPPTIFPLRRDEGLPWITSDVLQAGTLYRDVELDGDASRGFAYCYRRIPVYRPGDATNSGLRYATRVDGVSIFGEETDARMSRDRPWPFLERDEFLYFQEAFGLN